MSTAGRGQPAGTAQKDAGSHQAGVQKHASSHHAATSEYLEDARLPEIAVRSKIAAAEQLSETSSKYSVCAR